jgi:hypothetical protein
MSCATVRPRWTAWVLMASLALPLCGCRSGGGLTGWSTPSWMSWNNWGWGNRTASSLAQNKPSTTVPKPSTTTPPQPLSSVAAGTGNSSQGSYAPNPHYTTVTGTYPPGTSPAVAAAGLSQMPTTTPPGTPSAGYQTGPYSTTSQPSTSPYPSATYPTAGYPVAGNTGYPTTTPAAAAAPSPQPPATTGYPTTPYGGYAGTSSPGGYAPSTGYAAAAAPSAGYPSTGYPSSTPSGVGYSASTTYPTTTAGADSAPAYGQPAYPTTAPSGPASTYTADAGSRYGGSVYGPSSTGVATPGTAPAAYQTPVPPTTPSAATGVWSGYRQPANAPYDQHGSTSPAYSNEGTAGTTDVSDVATSTGAAASGRGGSIYGGPVEATTSGSGEASPAASSGGVAVASYPPVPSSLAPEAGGYRPGSTAGAFGVQNAGYQQPAATATAPTSGGSVYGGTLTR